MVSDFTRELGPSPRWCVDRQYRHLGTWKVLRDQRDPSEIGIRIQVAPIHNEGVYQYGKALIVTKNIIQDRFVVDSAADSTVVAGRIAKQLKLPLGKLILVDHADGHPGPYYQSSIRLGLGCSWSIVPCLIRYPLNLSFDEENLLGRRGLLEENLLCLSSTEVNLFRRKLATIENKKGPF